jgi:hypothetical protein
MAPSPELEINPVVTASSQRAKIHKQFPTNLALVQGPLQHSKDRLTARALPLQGACSYVNGSHG